MGVAAAHLAQGDPAFAAFLADAPECVLGTPFHESDLETLVFAVIGQQISAKAADAITLRLLERTGRPVTAHAITHLGEGGLRDVGFTRSKARTVLGLAAALTSGDLDFAELRDLSDDEVVATLSRFWGIGRWTSEMFLIFRLGRCDVWPTGDLGVRKGWAAIHKLPQVPSPQEMERAADHLRPYRSVAAWYCWVATREDTVFW